MAWNQGGGGGPWGGRPGGGNGGGNGGNGPWGGGRRPVGSGGGNGGGQEPPDIEEMLRRGKDRFRQTVPGGFGYGKVAGLLGAVALIAWLGSGFYVVDPKQQGLELVFGEITETSLPGWAWNWPAPVGAVEILDVTEVKREEIGFRTRSGTQVDELTESLMLTGDENIIDVQFVVFWVIKDARDFAFNVSDPKQAVKSVAESAMREVIGKTEFESARTKGRAQIQNDVMDLMQVTLDDYGAGIQITQLEMQKVNPPESVMQSFHDVQAARADKERKINEAQADANEKLERAEGERQRIIRDAEGYREEKIAQARGAVEQFTAVQKEYAKNPDLIARRIYLETMENVLGNMDKLLIEDQGGSGAVPYLSLNELRREQQVRRSQNQAREVERQRREAGEVERGPAPAPTPTNVNRTIRQ